MKLMIPDQLASAALQRRRFVTGLAAGGVLLGATAWSHRARAMESAASPLAAPAEPEVLSGTEFDLVVAESLVNFTGRPALATTINGTLPGPTLRWREGDTVTLRVTNRLREPTSIHWHGVIVPTAMDGVPGLSFGGIAPGTTFTYRFKVMQSGTYWYHSHSGHQELTGMMGAIVVEPAQRDPFHADRDYTVHLSDWTDEDPMAAFRKLKVQSSYFNYNLPTALQFLSEAAQEGLPGAYDRRAMWNQMRMNPTDLSDLSASTLTYLMNGRTPAGNWTGLFRPGERVRLRFINGGGHTFYDVRIPGLPLKIIQADGGNVEPVTVDEFRIGPGETYDAIVEPQDEACTIFAQSMDRTGYARGTLAVRAGLEAPVPQPDAPVWLSMDDMMGSMEMSHAGHDAHEAHHAHESHDGHEGHGSPGSAPADALARPSTRARHASTEYGASTDNRVDSARTTLDDPGVGLRGNGRRVLTLADLHALGGAPYNRLPERELELHLTGNMERYTWSLDGLEFGRAAPVRLRYGERLRVILHNDTMMTHPMHLHGMWSELEAPDGTYLARRHTIPVQPAQRVSFRLTADAMGRWAWHCHMMFHMHAGMFREVRVA